MLTRACQVLLHGLSAAHYTSTHDVFVVVHYPGQSGQE